MRIGMVLDKNFPPDIRVEKEARTLLAAGNDVHLLAYGRVNASEPTEENVDGLLVRRIAHVRAQMPSLQLLCHYLRFYLTFQNRYWSMHIERYAREFKLTALHVHDLPLLRTGISVGERLGIPVIADLHENYPAALKVWAEDERDPKGWFAENPRRWMAYERQAVQGAAHVIVVVDEAKQRLMEHHGLADEKITIVMNVEDVDHFQGIRPDPEILARYRDSFLISYIGGGGRHRGLDTAIRSMSYLRDAIPGVKLLLVGPQDAERDRLQALAEDEGVMDLVVIIGWQPFRKMPSYIHASEVCLVPYHQNPHTNSTIPHKLFQCMLMGKPVVVSSCPPLKRIVEETGSGLAFQAGDPRDLARQIQTLYSSKQLQEDCGRCGHQAVLNRYNWERESEKLIEVYKRVVSRV